jgi:hypothetical protein
MAPSPLVQCRRCTTFSKRINREGAKGVPAIKRRVPRSYAKKKTRLDFNFAQLRDLRAFAVKFFGLRAELALCAFAVICT